MPRSIDALFPKTRQLILSAVLMQANRWWYLSDLAKHLGLSPSSLQRELKALTTAGILRRRTEGNRVYFQADTDCPFFPELRGIIVKTVGIVDVLADVLKPFRKKIEWAFVFGSIAKTEERSASDVDLMVIGDVGLAELSERLMKAEKRIGREVNPHVYSRKEVAKKLKEGHHFLSTVFKEDKIFVIGKADELEAAFK